MVSAAMVFAPLMLLAGLLLDAPVLQNTSILRHPDPLKVLACLVRGSIYEPGMLSATWLGG